MKLFVTGASGWIGSAVVPELLEAGHQVIGLARSEKSALALEAAGASVCRGDLDDLEGLRTAAANSDGVIHLAFKHDIAFSGDFQGAANSDRQAVEMLGKALEGSDRPLVIASGLLGISPGHMVTEEEGHDVAISGATSAGGPTNRQATAEFVLSLASKGVRSVIIRLPPTNHGLGDNGFMSSIVAIARATQVSGYSGDGLNRWPAVHRLDSANLFRLAIEKAPAGSTLHAVADEGVAIRDIAEVIGQQLAVPVLSIPSEESAEHFGWLNDFLALDSPASSKITRALMDWQPTHSNLIEDLKEGHYFKG